MKRIVFRIERKIVFVTLIFAALSNGLIAQTDPRMNPDQYLFPEFTDGSLLMKKTGRVMTLELNYNIVTGNMVFLQDGQVYDLVKYADLDTVYMNDRKFIPVGSTFYEVGVLLPVSLYIQHKGDVKLPPKPGAYGTTSEVSSSTYMNNLQLGSDVVKLKQYPNLVIRHEYVYWTGKDLDSLDNFITAKQLRNIYPEISQEIKQYIKKNRVKFDKPDQVTSLIKYCNTL